MVSCSLPFLHPNTSQLESEWRPTTANIICMQSPLGPTGPVALTAPALPASVRGIPLVPGMSLPPAVAAHTASDATTAEGVHMTHAVRMVQMAQMIATAGEGGEGRIRGRGRCVWHAAMGEQVFPCWLDLYCGVSHLSDTPRGAACSAQGGWGGRALHL